MKYISNASGIGRSNGVKSFMAFRNAFFFCIAGAMVSGCVSQDNVLNLNGTHSSLSSQPVLETPTGVEFPGQQTALLPTQSSEPLPSNVPRPAPRGSSSIDSEIQTSALAVSDPNPAPIPAERVIQSVAPSTTTDSVNGSEIEPEGSGVSPELETASLAVPADSSTIQEPARPKITGLFARLFQSNNTSGAQRSRRDREDDRRIAVAHAGTRITQSNEKSSIRKRINLRDHSALPGVKSNAQLFGIGRSGQNGTSDDTAPATQLAAVGSLGRLSPNGLRVQHEKVQVSCLKPGILRILKVVERHYGKKPIITSGYRSPKRNRRAGGVKNSMHIFCKAVDIQIEGVSKWDLAKYLRTIPGRGGVGTYCRTKSVHIDTGSIRDWHHPCRRSSKRKKA